jgi:hypothetical protein
VLPPPPCGQRARHQLRERRDAPLFGRHATLLLPALWLRARQSGSAAA